MAYHRAIYGIEWDPPAKEPDAPWLLWLLALILVAVIGSAVWNAWFRDRGPDVTPTVVVPPVAEERPGSAAPAAGPAVRSEPCATVVRPARAALVARAEDYPEMIRNQLLKLEVTTNLSSRAMILNSLRGMQEAAGIENRVSGELGRINDELLFAGHDRRWVKEIEVRPGESGARIARNAGMTLAALAKLNGGSVDRLRSGQKLLVFRFGKPVLVVRRASRFADLTLDGRFFARYHLAAPVGSEAGTFRVSASPRAFWAERGVVFSAEDRPKVDLMIPPGATVSVSEL